MFENNKVIADLYFIAFVGCLLAFFRGHSWGYLAAAGVWFALGIYCLIRRDDKL